MTAHQPMESKYRPLAVHLEKAGSARIPMTFGEIESIIGTDLPPSARKHRAWWSNNPSNSVITYAWLSAGYKTAEVDIARERLTFIRRAADSVAAENVGRVPKRGRHPAWSALKGSTVIAEGVDLTQPVDLAWGGFNED